MTHRAQQSVHRIFPRATSAREHLSARAMASTTAARARVSHAHDPRTSRLGARARVPRGLAARTPARNATSLPRRVSPRASSDDSPASDVDAPGASPSGVPEALSRRLRAEAAQRTAQRTARVAAGVARAQALRVGLADRSTHVLVDLLPVDDVLGAVNDQHSPTVTDDVAREDDPRPVVHFANVEVLARHYGLPPAGSSPSADDDRACLARLASRMDATAQRALLYSRPKHRDVDVLSSLLVGDDEYVQRFRVCDPETGEVSILTLRMALDERLAPDYKSAVVVRHWTVRSVVGESESPDDDREDATEVTSARKLRPQARRSPETVADAHIAALRESDAATAALYFRTAAGARGLAAAVEAGRLAPLMDPDARLDVLRSAQLSADAHARVVRATTRATGKEGAAFVVVLGRDTNGAWGVDATAPVPAADLRRWKPPAEA